MRQEWGVGGGERTKGRRKREIQSVRDTKVDIKGKSLQKIYCKYIERIHLSHFLKKETWPQPNEYMYPTCLLSLLRG